ncbi:hypothetical protein MM239_04410 [Belliella sp. DSM 111904]|uniref:Uncharacterized protein n=1 Tax=Belliella filtrata TaxID=2923435 RepID=A0ABS9UWT0_9BACT|nr:hypothetical protein [Belliella filtrata]MCH7408626.1 hypothetical protein [Belliella filtrata]
MGFIPIILTMVGAIMLFIMVVKQSIAQKRVNIETLTQKVAHQWSILTNGDVKSQPSLDSLSQIIKSDKPQLQKDQLQQYESTIKDSLIQAKLMRVQHNKLISKRPYSFVAKIFGYKAI